jgi:predicted aspartyl protease
MRVRLSIALSVLAAVAWAVPVSGAAHFFAGVLSRQVRRDATLPQPARFRVNRDRGLLINTWVNGRGPFVFVIDTGAGLNVVSEWLVTAAGLKVMQTRQTLVGGLSGVTTSSNREASIDTLALGFQNNLLPPGQTALIVSQPPAGVDGILDPTEAFAPYGYSIDMPRGQIEALDSAAELSHRSSSDDTTVDWLRRGDSGRPFVRLGDGRLALIDTGSRFGLAVSDRQAIVIGGNKATHTIPSLDLGGGTINARRVEPTTISIGELVLRGIPTDILSGVAADAPVILGRDALYPFKISFDPRRKSITFTSSEK